MVKNALNWCSINYHMKEQRADYHPIIDNLTTALMLFDENRCLTSINSSGEVLLLVSRNKVVGMTPEQIWPNNPFFVEAINKSYEIDTVHIQRGAEMNLPNNKKTEVDYIVTPISNNNESKQVLVELLNANSFTRVLQEFNQHTLQKAAKDSLQGIAHEIKNPLGGIRGAAQLMEKKMDDQDLKEFTTIIIKESDRLRKFVDRMLSTNTHSGKADTNIHEVTEYVISIVNAEDSRNLNILKDYDPSIPNTYIDREQIIQSVLNLLRNAVQATNEKQQITIKTRVERKVTIQNKLNNLAIRLDIIDDGPGIPSEIESGAFFPMVTGNAEGTGLGLSIAQQLVQSQSGTITYERKNNNTYFSVFLPIEESNE